MGEVKEKNKSDRSLLRIMIGGYLVYIGVKLYKGATTVVENRTIFLIFSSLFVFIGLLCIVRAVSIMVHRHEE